MPRVPMLLRIAEVLRVNDLSDLTGGQQLPVEAFSKGSHDRTPAVADAMLGAAPGTDVEPDLPALTGRIDDAWRRWVTLPDQKSSVADVLSGLLAEARAAVRALDGTDRRRAQAELARVYSLAQCFFAYQPRGELVWVAADRAMVAAQDADDPLPWPRRPGTTARPTGRMATPNRPGRPRWTVRRSWTRPPAASSGPGGAICRCRPRCPTPTPATPATRGGIGIGLVLLSLPVTPGRRRARPELLPPVAAFRSRGRGRLRAAHGRPSGPTSSGARPGGRAGSVRAAGPQQAGMAPARCRRSAQPPQRTRQRHPHDRPRAPRVGGDGAVQPVRAAGSGGVVRPAVRGPAGRPGAGRTDRPRQVVRSLSRVRTVPTRYHPDSYRPCAWSHRRGQ